MKNNKDSSPEDLERWREYNRIEERRHDAEFVEYLKTKKQCSSCKNEGMTSLYKYSDGMPINTTA